MSRFLKSWSRFFMQAATLRTYAETLLLFFALVLFLWLLYGSGIQDVIVISLLFFLVPCCGLYYALRLRPPTGGWVWRIASDALRIAVPCLGFHGAILVYAHEVLKIFPAEAYRWEMDALFLALLAFPYVFFRIAVRVCVWWNGLRQRRLIWSLVTSHLIAVALLETLIVLPVVVLFVSAGGIGIPPSRLSPYPLAQAFYRIQIALPIIGVSILGATAVLLIILPLSILVSYFFARRIKRRLDALLDAAHAAGDGNYSVRVTVSGQDEIATLQTDFNVMTTNLELKVNELRSEREKVDALLKSRRELMVGVSHELRTPIAIVRAYLDSARRQSVDDGEIRVTAGDLAIIERETERLQTLIDDLFALSRAEVDQLALKCVPLNAAALIERVVETVTPLAWRINRIEVLANVPALLPDVLADGSRLEQVLRNLIHNSLRHTPPGGLVVISAGEVDKRIQIQVRDTGEGIAPDDLPHIWERYYRGEANGGTGIGLTLVKSFTEAMGGQVAVESIVGEGACFTLMLPLAAQEEKLLVP
jgi:signal transduction histidine kinase